MKIFFIFLNLLFILSNEKCHYHKYLKFIKPKITLKKNEKILEDYHPLKITFDYSNISEKEMEYNPNIKLILKEASNILNQLISIKNVKKIQFKNNILCNRKVKLDEDLSYGIDTDLIVVPLIQKVNKKVTGRSCVLDKEYKRTVISLLYLPKNLQFNKNQVLHQLIHILGFNAKNVTITKKNFFHTFSTYRKLFKNFVEKTIKSETSDWNNNIFIKDIMSNENKYEDISELTLSLLKDKKKCYKINKCFIYQPIKRNIIYYGIDSNNKLICYLNSKNNIKNNKCGINKYFLKSDIYQKSKNYNFKIYQTLYLLSPSEKCPNKHPRTVWFYNNNKYTNRTIPKKFKIEKYEITNEDYVVSFNLRRMRDCFLVAFRPLIKINGVSIKKNSTKVNLFDEPNYYNEKKILKRIETLNKYTQTTNFHFINSISNKDNLHRLYKKMNKKFPNDYNYMQETYILPEDKEIIQEKFINYTISKDNLWIEKPANAKLGFGIKFLTSFNKLYKKGVVTKYIHNPLLLYGKKFDLRLYVLISSFLPLKIYFNKEGLVRVTTNDYNLDEKNFKNIYIHLTHTVLNMRNKNFTHPVNFTDERGHLWSMEALKNYIKRNGKDDKKLFEDIKDVIIKSIISSNSIFTKESRKKYYGKKVSTIFGFDILIDENLKPWLLEINGKCPDLSPHNIVDETIKTELMTSYLNIIGLVPFSHKSNKPLDDVYEYKDKIEKIVDDSLCEFERVDGSFERIFPLKDNIDYYKKFFESPGKENELLWEKLKDFD